MRKRGNQLHLTRGSTHKQARRTRDIPTLKPASKRDPAPFDQVEVPTDKLDVVCKMVDGVSGWGQSVKTVQRMPAPKPRNTDRWTRAIIKTPA